MGAASAVAEIKVAPKAKAAPGAMSSPTYGMVDLLPVRGMVVVMKHPHSLGHCWELGPDHIGRSIFAEYLTFTIHSWKRGNIQEHNWKSLIFGRARSSGFRQVVVLFNQTCDLVIGIEQVTKTSWAIPSS
jgi:hypothetical protein